MLHPGKSLGSSAIALRLRSSEGEESAEAERIKSAALHRTHEDMVDTIECYGVYTIYGGYKLSFYGNDYVSNLAKTRKVVKYFERICLGYVVGGGARLSFCISASAGEGEYPGPACTGAELTRSVGE